MRATRAFERTNDRSKQAAPVLTLVPGPLPLPLAGSTVDEVDCIAYVRIASRFCCVMTYYRYWPTAVRAHHPVRVSSKGQRAGFFDLLRKPLKG